MKEVRYRYDANGDKIAEYYYFKFIKEEKWHNPTRLVKVLRIINYVILSFLFVIMMIYFWNEYILGKYVLLALFLTFNPLLWICISHMLNEISKDIESVSESNSGIKVEETTYDKYLSEIKENKWISIVMLTLILFICTLVFATIYEKVSELIDIGMFFRLFNEKCLFYLISIFGGVYIIVNLFFLKTLHFSLSNKLRNSIYY